MMHQMPSRYVSAAASRAARLIAEGALSKLVAKIFAGLSQSAALAKLELALAISVPLPPRVPGVRPRSR